jgi:hypothetical protein
MTLCLKENDKLFCYLKYAHKGDHNYAEANSPRMTVAKMRDRYY